jgi:23S rRNA (cytosine1962-C5)-methyltransferase
MFSADQYQLLDFGEGRKLESFAGLVVDRPAPVSEGTGREDPDLWQQADLRYEREQGGAGKWIRLSGKHQQQADWQLLHGNFQLKLRMTPSGHVGVFPEQAANWDWITRQVQRSNRPLKVLNLFAYTGGSTLAAAAAGADVVHVDAARNVVSWARQNADVSGLGDHPIRWINEDARVFVQRELKRGNHYDIVILDPPSYGHGPDSQAWKIHQHLPALLKDCAALTSQQRAAMLITCHTPTLGPAELESLVADTVFGHCQAGVSTQLLDTPSADGRILPAGTVCCWPESS